MLFRWPAFLIALPILLTCTGVGALLLADGNPASKRSSAEEPISASQKNTVLVPALQGEWRPVAGNPDLGALNSPGQQPVDFAIWQANDGSWQLWSCIRSVKTGGHTRLFYRWEGRQLTDRNWKPMGIALRSDPQAGEDAEGLQAPHVIKHDGLYHLFFGDWNHICHAESHDGKNFTRVLDSNGKSGLFGEGADANTRDPMVLVMDDTFFCFYCACPNRQGAVYCRTSKDLKTWSEPRKVAYGGSAGTGPSSAECPHGIVHDGWYYLFRTQRYGHDAQTSVYRSKEPMDFGIDNDCYLVTRLPVAAPEIIEHEGQLYLAALNPNLDGIQIARLGWEPATLPKP